MIDIKPYVQILNSNSLINMILNICYLCIIINFIIWAFGNKDKNDDKDKNNEEQNFSGIDVFGNLLALIIVIIIIILLTKTSFFNIAGIPLIFTMIYILYIKPMIKIENEKFNYEYYSYGAILTISLSIIQKIDYNKYLESINSHGIIELITIITLLMQIYLVMYVLLLNIYFVIKNLEKINIKVFLKKYTKVENKLIDKFYIDNMDLKFKKTQFYCSENKNIKTILRVIVFFILNLIISVLKQFLTIIFSIFVLPILYFINFIIKLLIKISHTDINKVNYSITKVISVISFITTYIILQINTIIFQPKIISVYEYISTAILIPIILESIMTLKGKIKKETN